MSPPLPPRPTLPPTAHDRISRLEERLDDAIVALGYVRDRAEANGEERRSLRQDVEGLREEVGEVRSEVHAVQTDVGKILAEVSDVRRLLGRWPANPDDTGSGLAGKMARMSVPDPEEANPQKKTMPPAALVALWGKHRRVATMLVFLVSLVYAALETGAVRLGGPSEPARPSEEVSP